LGNRYACRLLKLLPAGICQREEYDGSSLLDGLKVTDAQGAVIATRPAKAPFKLMPTSGLPNRKGSVTVLCLSLYRSNLIKIAKA
jgi:hypothetical protein